MSSSVEYIHLENDIHKFVWHSNDRHVALEYIEQIQ